MSSPFRYVKITYSAGKRQSPLPYPSSLVTLVKQFDLARAHSICLVSVDSEVLS